MLTGGGKAGTLYLLNISSADASCAQIHHLAFWNRTGSNPALLYLWASNDTLKAFSFIGGLISTAPVAQNSAIANLPNGAAVALSANGSTAGSGILWAAMSTQNASSAAVPDMNPADQLGNLEKVRRSGSRQWQSLYGDLLESTGGVRIALKLLNSKA